MPLRTPPRAPPHANCMAPRRHHTTTIRVSLILALHSHRREHASRGRHREARAPATAIARATRHRGTCGKMPGRAPAPCHPTGAGAARTPHTHSSGTEKKKSTEPTLFCPCLPFISLPFLTSCSGALAVLIPLVLRAERSSHPRPDLHDLRQRGLQLRQQQRDQTSAHPPATRPPPPAHRPPPSHLSQQKEQTRSKGKWISCGLWPVPAISGQAGEWWQLDGSRPGPANRPAGASRAAASRARLSPASTRALAEHGTRAPLAAHASLPAEAAPCCARSLQSAPLVQ